MSLRPNERAEVRRNKGKMAVDDEGGQRPEDIITEDEGNFVAAIYSEDRLMQLKAMNQLNNLDSIDEIMKYEVVPRFVEFLRRDEYPQLQFEAALALINITSGTTEDTKVVVDLGAVPIFVKLLLSQCNNVREMAVWALGNIAGDSPRFRDFVLANGALIPLLQILNEDANLSMLRTASWTLRNICCWRPPPDFEQTRPALPVFKRLIQLKDEKVLIAACYALSCLSESTNVWNQHMIDAGVFPKLVELLLDSSWKVIFPVLHIVCHIAILDGAQLIIDHVLPYLLQLTYHRNPVIKKIACFTISCFTAGNIEQIQAVIDAGIIARVVQLVNTLRNTDIKIDAILVISSAASGGSHEQIKYLVSQGCIKALNDHLDCPNSKIVAQCIAGLRYFLKVPPAERSSASTGSMHPFDLEIVDAIMKIEKLLKYSNSEIGDIASTFMHEYWRDEGVPYYSLYEDSEGED